MITIDEKRIFETIIERKPRSVALNGPEALISKIQDSANNITEKFDIPAYVKKIFEEYDYHVIIGRGKGQLNDAQVFGCEFYPAYDVQKQVDAYIFLGQSMFHCVSVAISTEKPTYMLDPYFKEYSRVNEY